MKLFLIIAAWAYFNIGCGLLIFRGDNIHRPVERFKAWAFWPFRSWKKSGWMGTGYSEFEFYGLPISEQRRLLGLRHNQNPSAPSFFKRPEPVRMPQRDPLIGCYSAKGDPDAPIPTPPKIGSTTSFPRNENPRN